MTPDLKCELRRKISSIFFPSRPQNWSGYQYLKKYFRYLSECESSRVSVSIHFFRYLLQQLERPKCTKLALKTLCHTFEINFSMTLPSANLRLGAFCAGTQRLLIFEENISSSSSENSLSMYVATWFTGRNGARTPYVHDVKKVQQNRGISVHNFSSPPQAPLGFLQKFPLLYVDLIYLWRKSYGTGPG